MIFIASDHGGFHLKNNIIEWLLNKGFEVKDMGAFEHDSSDDYPDFVIPAMKEVQKDTLHNFGILLCRNGVGVCIAANKFKGIRCALSWKPEHARSSRIDDNTNVLALPADYMELDDVYRTVETWLLTEYSHEDRHDRRLKKVEEIEG